LMAAAENPDPGVRLRAGRALARAGSRSGEQPLLRLLNDQNPEVRKQAVVATLRFPQTPEITELVDRIASDDPVGAVRERARQALNRRSHLGAQPSDG